jgi:SAM-dependent methyltransferase
MSSTATPDYRTITQRQQRIWSAGDFARVGTARLLVGELLCERIDIHPGELVLDVAGGHGNTALAAARRWAEVTTCDFVPHLLHTAQQRARIEHLPLTVHVADTHALPFDDGSFDVVLSTFGAMFAPDQQKTADQLLRLPLRRTNRNGQLDTEQSGRRNFPRHQRPSPPPAGVRPPVQWGQETRLRELFGDRIALLYLKQREVVFRYHSAEHRLEYFRTWYGRSAWPSRH